MKKRRFESVRADYAVVVSPRDGFLARLALPLVHPGLQAVVLYRVAHWCHLRGLTGLAAVITYISSIVTGAQISARASIGKGLAVHHPHGIVVGADTHIGDYCTLMHSNVIGQMLGGNDRPAIGNHFYAGAGAKVLGAIRIGNRVRVGANSVVIDSLPDDVTVFGMPARITYRRSIERSKDASKTENVVNRLRSLIRSVQPEIESAAEWQESNALAGAVLGFDSVDSLKIVCAIEEEFGVTIDEESLTGAEFATVGALAQFVMQQLRGRIDA